MKPAVLKGSRCFILYAEPSLMLNACMAGARAKKKTMTDKDTQQAERVKNFNALLKDVARKQSRESFVELFEYYAPRIKSYFMKGGFDADLADELAQETMINVWNKADSFDSAKSNANTWIYTIARNKRIDKLRQAKRAEVDIDDPLLNIASAAPSQDEGLDDQRTEFLITEALSDLPDEQSNLIRKSFFEDKTHSDIAKETNLPLGTVKSRIRLALAKLREKLDHKGVSDVL